jgi:hypothetical protein
MPETMTEINKVSFKQVIENAQISYVVKCKNSFKNDCLIFFTESVMNAKDKKQNQDENIVKAAGDMISNFGLKPWFYTCDYPMYMKLMHFNRGILRKFGVKNQNYNNSFMIEANNDMAQEAFNKMRLALYAISKTKNLSNNNNSALLFKVR